MDLLQQAFDADLYTHESSTKQVIPTRALFTDVKELAYLSEIDERPTLDEQLDAISKKTGIPWKF